MQLRVIAVVALVAVMATVAMADAVPERDLIEVNVADLAVGKTGATQRAMQAHLEELRSEILPLHRQICSDEDACAERRLENARIVEDVVERRCYRKKGCDVKAPCYKSSCKIVTALKHRHRALQRAYNKMYRRFVLTLAKYYRKRFVILSKVFTRTIKSLRLHAHKVEAKNRALTDKLAKVDAARLKAQREADGLDDENEKNKADLKASRGKHARALRALKAEKSNVAALKKALAALRRDLSTSKKNHAAQKARAAAAEARNAKGAKLSAALRRQIAALKRQLSTSSARAAALGKIVSGLRNQVNVLNRLVSSARRGRANATRGNAMTRAELNKCRSDYAKYRTKYQRIVAAHKKAAAAKDKQITHHKKRAADTQKKLAALTKAHKATQDKLKKMVADAARKRAAAQAAARRRKAGVFHRFGITGIILAQAACTAMGNQYQQSAAVRRVCNGRTPSCNTICARLGRRTVTSLHIYSNQPFWKARQIGLKTFKYNSRHTGGCGPNYCCCTTGNGAHNGPAELDLEVPNNEATEGEPDEDEIESVANSEDTIFSGPDNTEDAEEDIEESEDEDEAESADVAKLDNVRLPGGWNRYALHAQIMAQGACVAMAKRGGWVFAVRRYCSGRHRTCASVCHHLRDGQAGRLRGYNSLHLYTRQPQRAPGSLGMITHRYNGAGGGCGPNYCCCSSHSQSEEETEDFELPDSKIQEIEVEATEEEDEDTAEAVDMEVDRFERYAIDGQVQAQAACVAMAPHTQRKHGWVFAVRRPCHSRSPSCTQICQSMGERQAGNRLWCFNALHIYNNQGFNSPQRLGLKTYRYNNCNHGGCGPNYCCCWKGSRGVRP